MTRTGNQKFAQHIHHSGQIVDPDDASTTVESSLGSAQTVRLLGPFSIGHADIAGAGGNFPIVFAALPDGSVVTGVSIYVSEAFDTDVQMQIGIAPSDDPTNASDLLQGGNGSGANVAVVLSGEPSRYLLPARASNGSALLIEPAISVDGTSLIAYFTGLSAAGQLDIYALIATSS